MRNHYILALIITALVTGMVGCEKGDGRDDAKPYLLEGGPAVLGASGKLPASPKNPCVAKGAVGAMGLLLKGGSCEKEKPKPAVCGNKATESGEECDSNPNCGSNCKWLASGGGGGTGGGSTTNGSVTIKTTSLPVAYQNEPYTATLSATCKPSPCNFALAAGAKLPDGFKIASGKLSSDKVTADVGAHPTTIVVQNKDGSQSATQALSLTVQKHLNIRTFVEGFTGFEVVDVNADKKLDANDFDPSADYSDKQAFIPIISDGKLVIEPSHYNHPDGCTGVPAEDKKAEKCNPEFGWLVVGVNFKIDNEVVDKDLNAASDAEAAAKYTWSIKGGDGKDLPHITFQQAYNTQKQKSVDYMWAVKPSSEKFYGTDFEMFYFYKDQEFKDVKITVSDDKGNQGELTISDLVFKAPLELKAAQEAYDACHNLKVEKLTIDDHDCTASGQNGAYSFTWQSLAMCNSFTPFYKSKPDEDMRVDRAYDGALTIKGGSGNYAVSNLKREYDSIKATAEDGPSAKVANNKATIHWTPFSSFKSKNYTITDTTTFDVSDNSANCKQTAHVTIYRSLKYPDYREMTVKDVKLYADFDTEWTDGDSKIRFDLMGKNDNGAEIVLAETALESADGDDPTCFNRYFTLNPVGGHGEDSISKITYVRLGGADAGGMDMVLYFKYLRLDVQSGGKTMWYAEAGGDFCHDDNCDYDSSNWEYNAIGRPGDSSVFTTNPNNYNSIWFYGEPGYHAQESECD